MTKSIVVNVDKLAVGMYVDIRLNWSQHPFLFSKFKIKSKSEIDIIKKLVREVLVYPQKSDVRPEVPSNATEESSEPSIERGKSRTQLWDEKQDIIAKANEYKLSRQKVAKQYREAQKRVRNLCMDLKTSPANAIRDANLIIDDMTASFANAENVLVNLVNLSSSSYSFHNHALNVTVLAFIAGHSLGLKEAELRVLGVSSILHDIGKVTLPAGIVNKSEKLTASEEKLLQGHIVAGVRLVSKIEGIPEQALEVIANHHEFLDGSGYPRGVKEKDISTICRLITIADIYDNLCNPRDSAKAVSPKTAMATLYSKFKGKLDLKLVQHFIQTFGIYPPGTIVELSDQSTGLVVSVNSGSALKPKVLLYNPDIPVHQSILLDLSQHDDIDITNVIKAADCPERVTEYLGIQDKMGYFFDTGK